MRPHGTPPRSRVGVLGATGCVGRATCDAFADAGYEVVAVARRHAPHIGHHTFVPLDVAAAAPGEIAEIVRSAGIGIVVNATGGWGRTEEEMTYGHVQLIEHLLAGLAALPSPVRLVHVGSIHEYGEVAHGTPISESTPSNPATAYAQTKLAGSEAILRAARAGQVDGVVLKAANVCGPYTTEASFLGAVLAKIAASGDGEHIPLTIAEAWRDYVDVRDLAAAVLAAACEPATAPVVNIGRGVAESIRHLVHELVIASGRTPDAIEELAVPVQSKGGGWTLTDISLARRLLGWQPRIALSDSMAATWQTYISLRAPTS